MNKTPPQCEETWKALTEQQRRLADTTLVDLFAENSDRFRQMSLRTGELLLDYSKNRTDASALANLFQLARACELESARDAMFRGDPINNTEHRAVLHTALRCSDATPILVDGKDILPDIHSVLDRMEKFSDAVRSGEWTGHTGRTITDVVNIGIGGSDLGPAMVCAALHGYQDATRRLHFVSNVDGEHIGDVLAQLSPDTTLFIVASKTFTTQETLKNAHSARQWLLDAGVAKTALAKHFAAVSAAPDKAEAFGINRDQVFPLWDWVGGRYSLWSAIGLPIAIAVGMDRFRELLAGADTLDRHFRTAPLEKNMPVILALLGIWYRNFFGASSYAVLPYSQRLARFPAYLQQLDMESNGKSVNRDGDTIGYATGPVIWGEPGTNGQHAFYQLLHQGTDWVPCDVLLAANAEGIDRDSHELLMANALAQTQALMQGKPDAQLQRELEQQGLSGEALEQMRGHKTFRGNRPSNTLLYPKLTPSVLGQLIALYEHKVFCQGHIWNINSFDQWGVELGKQLAPAVLNDLRGDDTASAHDASTNGLIQALKTLSQNDP